MNRKQRKLREKGFVDHWNVGEQMKDYDALADYYASSYFCSPKVKKHLRNFTKATRKQPKTVDLLRMTQLLGQRYNWHDNKSKGPNHSVSDQSVPIITSHSQPNLQFNKKHHKNKSSNPIRQNTSKNQQQQKLPDIKIPKPQRMTRMYKSTDRQVSISPIQKKKHLKYIQMKKKQIYSQRYGGNKK